VSCGVNGEGATFVGQSPDGSHVFFTDSQGLYSWSRETALASQLSTATEVSQLVPSANGQYAIGLTKQLATNPNGTADVYEFSIGHPPMLITSGTSADTYTLREGPTNGGVLATAVLATQGGVSNDGSRVVYDDTPAGGAPEVVDEWVAGRPSQISPQDSAFPYFALGTAGDELQDVFFVSRQALVIQDHNAGTPDIYDARIDGGFAGPTVSSCEGEGCQGSPTAGAGVALTPGSEGFSGQGNEPAPPPAKQKRAPPKKKEDRKKSQHRKKSAHRRRKAGRAIHDHSGGAK
jgi:hypothetical protein